MKHKKVIPVKTDVKEEVQCKWYILIRPAKTIQPVPYEKTDYSKQINELKNYCKDG